MDRSHDQLIDFDELGDLIDFLRPYVDEIDGPPPACTELAKAAYSMRDLDAQLADLIHDSSLSTAAPAGVRSTALVRTMSFDLGEGVAVEVEFLADRLVGELDGAELVGVEWHTPGDHGRAGLVEADHFEIVNPPRQTSFYLVFDLGARQVATDWLLH